MRRNVAIFASICGLLAASALGASTTATAAESTPEATEGLVPLTQEVFEELIAEADGSEFSTLTDDEGPLALWSALTERYVTAELGYSAPNTGLARARSDYYYGAWEGVTFAWDENWDPESGEPQTLGIRSNANDLYFAVEKNFTGQRQNALRARSESIGGWETFTLWYNEDDPYDHYLRSELNGLLVSVEKNYSGSLQYLLRARTATAPGSWETFEIHDAS